MPAPALAEVLAQFETILTAPDGWDYVPRACAREGYDGRWEGWVEFISTGQGTPFSSPIDTIQPNRTDAVYWADGLTVVYLEGALQRAWAARASPNRRAKVLDEGPLPIGPATPALAPESSSAPQAVLDPFQVYRQGEAILIQQLRALSVLHLEQIVRVFNIPLNTPNTEEGMPSRAVLEEAILSAVQRA